MLPLHVFILLLPVYRLAHFFPFQISAPEQLVEIKNGIDWASSGQCNTLVWFYLLLLFDYSPLLSMCSAITRQSVQTFALCVCSVTYLSELLARRYPIKAQSFMAFHISCLWFFSAFVLLFLSNMFKLQRTCPTICWGAQYDTSLHWKLYSPLLSVSFCILYFSRTLVGNIIRWPLPIRCKLKINSIKDLFVYISCNYWHTILCNYWFIFMSWWSD